MLNVAMPVMSSFLLSICVLVTAFPALASMGDVPIGQLILQAKNGNTEAQDELGLRYASGLDVEEDYAEAAKWYRAAAEQGHIGAQNELGGFYEKGIGVPERPRESSLLVRKGSRSRLRFSSIQLVPEIKRR